MFKNQVIWITGASSGIGEALALAFAGRGARLVLSARRDDELERVSAACLKAGAASVLVLPMDVTDFGAMPGLADHVRRELGRIDLLINNAGISQRTLCMDTDLVVYKRLLDVDVMGPIALTKAVLPIMIAQGGGHIAVTASIAGKVGVPLRTGYCAAKHGVMGFFDALRAETTAQNIRVTTITPGYIRTMVAHNALVGKGETFGRTDPNIENGMDPNDCARVILRGMERGRPEIAVGKGPEMQVLWIKRFFPGLAFRMMARAGRALQKK